MMEVKIFKMSGVITKPSYVTSFSKYVRALKKEDALEKMYADFGSQHRVKRFQIKLLSIDEVLPEETDDPLILQLSED